MAEFQGQTIRFDNQGRAVVPVKLRKELGVEKGDEVIAWVEEGRLVLEPRAALIAKMRAKYAVEKEGSLVDDFIAERRAEADKEWAELETEK